jgi:hypothetical protein
MRIARIAALCCFVSLLLLAQPGQGQRDRGDRGNRGWQLLGTAHVDGAADHDKITVSRSEGPFREIQLRVRGGVVEFRHVVVHYGNGGSDELQVRERIPAGGQTRPIDLRGDRRDIRSVELWYGKGRWRQRPTVELYGR